MPSSRKFMYIVKTEAIERIFGECPRVGQVTPLGMARALVTWQREQKGEQRVEESPREELENCGEWSLAMAEPERPSWSRARTIHPGPVKPNGDSAVRQRFPFVRVYITIQEEERATDEHGKEKRNREGVKERRKKKKDGMREGGEGDKSNFIIHLVYSSDPRLVSLVCRFPLHARWKSFLYIPKTPSILAPSTAAKSHSFLQDSTSSGMFFFSFFFPLTLS